MTGHVFAALRHADTTYRLLRAHKVTTEPGDTEEDGLYWAHSMWTDGNYGCDCNRSAFIAELSFDPGADDFPELPCGQTIALIQLAYWHDDGRVTSLVFNGKDMT